MGLEHVLLCPFPLISVNRSGLWLSVNSTPDAFGFLHLYTETQILWCGTQQPCSKHEVEGISVPYTAFTDFNCDLMPGLEECSASCQHPRPGVY